MYKLINFFILFFLLLICFSQDRFTNNKAAQLKAFVVADNLFKKADRLSDQAGDNESLQAKADEIYKQASVSFQKVIADAVDSKNDSLAFYGYIKTGLIEYYLNNADAAKSNYQSAIYLKEKLPAIEDSILFIPYLFSGAIFYDQNNIDSSLSYFKKAEAINDKYSKPLNESQRLYNKIGVIYYETGNYRQAKNYFEKAVILTRPNDISLISNYKLNIGSILVKLDMLDSAKSVYESILPYNIFKNEIYHNLAIISLKQEKYNSALEQLQKVKYPDNKKNIELFYNYGMAFYGLKQPDTASFYLQRALAENLRWNGRRKNTAHGLILKYQADVFTSQHEYKDALTLYQKAIMEFDNNFTETDINKNPEQFSAVYSYINLFNTLVAKADALKEQYNSEKENSKLLEASLAAYRSAFILADYVEKTYDSDEARLFLGKIKYTVHSRPINVAISLYELTRKKSYLEEAYLFDQRNKASILALNIQENEWRKQAGYLNDFFQQEANLRTAITRLSLKAGQITDSIELNTIAGTIRDNEIELGKIQEKINNDPAWQQKKTTEQIPTISQLQKKLSNTTALISYHLSGNELLTIFITINQLEFYKTPIDKNFFSDIEKFKNALQNTLDEQSYNGTAASVSLYKTLISPIHNKLSRITKLIIIPDDELNFLPFEALQDDNKNFLVEKFSVLYQYSTAFLHKQNNTTQSPGTLAFAPFASKGYKDSAGTAFSSLPASKDEISNLNGDIYFDSSATKNNFLASSNRYNIIHLATHASVNNDDPSRSFITFYPVDKDYKLYAREIYNMKLDSVQLIILSACETGAGQLIKGEGLMSLSRAFAYAGCPNIITSLWKAEDKTTAFLTERLHYYLEKDYSKDFALQQAKLDLLKSPDIEPRFKSPNYWAHLIFIGNYEPDHKRNIWWLVATCLIIVFSGYYFFKRRESA